jgi:hypothetical protein
MLRTASSALAAPTIGIPAVVAIVASLEASTYCEIQKELIDDENILYGTEKVSGYERCYKSAEEVFRKIYGEAMASMSYVGKDTFIIFRYLIESTDDAVKDFVK